MPKTNNSKTANSLVVIQEKNFAAHKIDGTVDFPHRDFSNPLAGEATAVAVLDKENKLLGVAVGRIKNDGRVKNNGTFVADGIKHNDGTIDILDQKSRITVGLDISGKDIKIKPEGAEVISKAVTDSVKKHNLAKAKAEVDKSRSIKPLGDDIILHPTNIISVINPDEQKKVPQR